MPYRVPKPGTLCAPHVFNIGDTFTTKNGIFAWSMQSIKNPSAGASGVAYYGSALNNCDVDSIYMTIDDHEREADYSVVIDCKSGVFGVSAKAFFSISPLPGNLTPLLGFQRAVNAQSYVGHSHAIVLDSIIRLANQDLGDRLRTSAAFSTNDSNTDIISVQANFDFCPASSGSSSCAQRVPKFNITNASTVSTSGSLIQNPNGEDGVSTLGDLFAAPVINNLQTIYAAVRMDLGIDSPNNYLLHQGVMNETLNASFPVTPSTPANADNTSLVSQLYSVWENPNVPVSSGNYSWMLGYLPLNVTGPASLQAVYPCKFQSLKSAGSLAVSVLVATLSMFSTAWAIYVAFLGMVLKRNGKLERGISLRSGGEPSS